MAVFEIKEIETSTDDVTVNLEVDLDAVTIEVNSEQDPTYRVEITFGSDGEVTLWYDSNRGGGSEEVRIFAPFMTPKDSDA